MDRCAGPLPSPEEAARYPYTPQDQAVVAANRERQFVGTPDTVVRTIRDLAAETRADEVMVTTMVYGRAERLRSYELLAAEWAK